MDDQPTKRQICDQLTALHAELERTETLDETEQAQLRHLMMDIQSLLERCAEEVSPEYRPDESLTGRFRQAIDALEVNHPTLTLMIEKTLDTLNIAGI